ncbi:MAG: TRAFAC clade GTPase domain-containing protein [Ardenticatenaceae bacterium]
MIVKFISKIVNFNLSDLFSLFLYIFSISSMTAVYIIYININNITSINNAMSITAFVVLLGLTAILINIIAVYNRTITDHPRALSIALVGPPNAGKTVYLTMLYKELETKEIEGLSFSPYGSRTIEVVARNIARMEQGEFPPPTPMESSFRYEAVASFSRRFITQKYRIQISDYAGEHLKEFDDADEMWLHHTDYFEYVVSADALLFMLDCETLLNGDSIPHLQSILVATVHTFIERRRSDPTKPSDVPVALLFSKSDVLSSKEDIEKITSQVSRLIAVCKKRFRYFRYFLVSSVGVTPKEFNDKGDPIPPPDMEPIGVVEPLIWLLGK